MKQWTRAQIMKRLQIMVPEINFLKTSGESDSKKGGIWTSGESDWFYKGLLVFDYNVEYGELSLSYSVYPYPKLEQLTKTMYVCGIHGEIYNWLEERGWYSKGYDGDTLFFWKNTSEHESDILKYISNHPEGDENGIAEYMIRLLNKKFSDVREMLR